MFELTIRDETAALRDYHDAIKRTINEHSLVGADLSELMSLPSAYVGTERETLLVYHEGVLKNLPVLVGLPDNIPDLATLRTTLKSAGGLVKLVSENIAEEFATKLEAIRTTSEAIVQEHTNIAAQIRESEEKNAKSEAAIVDAKRTFRNDVGIFIANLSTQLSLEEELSRH